MMIQNCIVYFRQNSKVFEQGSTICRMLLNKIPFIRRKPARFVKYIICNRKLSYIVHEPGVVNIQLLLFIHAHAFCHFANVGSNTGRVTLRICILVIDKVGERHHCLFNDFVVVILSLSCKLPLIFNNRLKNNYIKLGNCR